MKRPKYFYRHPEYDGDVFMLYATYPEFGYWLDTQGQWVSTHLNTAAIASITSYAPVLWKDVVQHLPTNAKPHKRTI